MGEKPLVSFLFCALLIVLAAAAPAAEAAAGDKIDFDAGFKDYQRYCQSCHGERGQGNGRVGKWLKVPPADLTGLSKRNNDAFPTERVAQVIDGREDIRTHGTREMPIWGQVFGEDGAGEDQVRRRIAGLVEVLRWFDDASDGPTGN